MFGTPVNNFGQFNKVNGSSGTVLIIMNLVCINSLVLLIGFELNVSITAVKSQKKALLENQEDVFVAAVARIKEYLAWLLFH